MALYVPKIENDFVCIVDHTKTSLAAVISSYISREGIYTPFFKCPSLTSVGEEPEGKEEAQDAMSRSRGHTFDVYVHNAIKRMRGCNNLIVAGLDADQISHLTFLGDYNVIEISTVDEVHGALDAFRPDQNNYLECASHQITQGLALAIRQDRRLRINENIDLVMPIEQKQEGIIIIEQNDSVATVLAINYAVATRSDLILVKPLAKGEDMYIKLLVEKWKDDDQRCYDEIRDKVFERVGDVNFSDYQYGTFFTAGLPYSVVLRNVIPFTYIHLLLQTDRFIFDNLHFENETESAGAVVFSPQFFKDEETNFVINRLKDEKFYVRELIGNEAKAHNLEMHISHFPYHWLHICSHGGEVNGFRVVHEFNDRQGNPHTIEYNEVVSFSPSGEKLIGTYIKRIWRKFDGMDWKSAQLMEADIPQFVFSDMLDALSVSEEKKAIVRYPVDRVYDSCSITCSDFISQAMFHEVSSLGTAPFIFNNSCWSWSGISDQFLTGGIRGYIGTFWAVEIHMATDVAKAFYLKLFSMTIAEALQKSGSIADGSASENIYMFWGTHFATLKKATDAAKSRKQVFDDLLHSFYSWLEKKDNVKSKVVKDNVERIYTWISDHLAEYFLRDYLTFRSKRASKKL